MKIIIVLGCALKRLQYDVTESNIMKNWLISNGISLDLIIEEPRSMNTIENIYYSRGIIDDLILSNDEMSFEIMFVTSEFHMERVKIIVEKLCKYENIKYISAKTEDEEEYLRRMKNEKKLIKKII